MGARGISVGEDARELGAFRPGLGGLGESSKKGSLLHIGGYQESGVIACLGILIILTRKARRNETR